MRTKVADHIDKVIEQSRKEMDEDGVMSTSAVVGEQVHSIHAIIRDRDADPLADTSRGRFCHR